MRAYHQRYQEMSFVEHQELTEIVWIDIFLDLANPQEIPLKKWLYTSRFRLDG